MRFWQRTLMPLSLSVLCFGRADAQVTCLPPVPASTPSAHYGVGFDDYTDDDLTLGGDQVRMAADVRYPAAGGGGEAVPAAAGTFPVIVFLHGNHGIFHTPEGPPELLGDRCSQQETSTEIASYEGFEPLLTALAASGYIAVSINANDLNCKFDRIPERAQLILAHLALLKRIASGAPDLLRVALAGHLDLAHLGLIGHSRGAEAVVGAAALNLDPSLVIAGVVSVAPTDAHFYALSGIPLFVVLPASDGDVAENVGLRIYDRANSGANQAWFKALHYLHGANHNYFNLKWLGADDGIGTQRLPPDLQFTYLTETVTSFFAATMRGDQAAMPAFDLSDGKADYHSFPLVRSFASGAAAPTGDALQTLVSSTGFSLAKLFPFAQIAAAFNPSFFDDISLKGLVFEWNAKTTASFTLPLAKLAAAGNAGGMKRQLVMRVGQIVDRINAPYAARDLTISLHDDAGGVATAGASAVGQTLTAPYARQDRTKTILQTLRLPLTCFEPTTAQFRWDHLQRIEVAPNAGWQSGSLAVSEIQVSL